MAEDAVEDFLRLCQVDPEVAKELREAPKEVQRHVLARGELSNARNQTSVLRARLRDARGSHASAPAVAAPAARPREKLLEVVPDPNWVRVTGMPSHADVADVVAFFDSKDFPPDKVIMDQDANGVLAYVRFATEPEVSEAIRLLRTSPPLGSDVLRAGQKYTPYFTPELDAVGQFLADNGVDEQASAIFRAAPVEQQQAAISRGNLRGVRNPSAALLSRLRGMGPPPMEPGPESRDTRWANEVEEFLQRYGVDEMASDAFRRSRKEVQQQILDRGLDGVRNPSSALQARLRELNQGKGKGEKGSNQGNLARRLARASRSRSRGRNLEEDVKEYLRRYQIDELGCDALHRQSPEVQVLERGLEGAYNPSTALMARIKEMNQKVKESGRGRHSSPRADRGPPRARGFRSRGPPIGQAPARPGLAQEVEEYLQRYGVDGAGCDAMRACAADVQETLLERGLDGTRNPSAALQAKIKEITKRKEARR